LTRQSAATIIFNPTGQVLLIQREDTNTWTFPGGGIDPGESPEQAAVREAKEESGYQVEILRNIGEYHRPQLHDIRHVFLGRIVGGAPYADGTETIQVAWRDSDDLPRSLNRHLRQFIWDALAEADQPFHRKQYFNPWEMFLIWLMFRYRDLRKIVKRL
jgi:mutator protein MutT